MMSRLSVASQGMTHSLGIATLRVLGGAAVLVWKSRPDKRRAHASRRYAYAM